MHMEGEDKVSTAYFLPAGWEEVTALQEARRLNLAYHRQPCSQQCALRARSWYAHNVLAGRMTTNMHTGSVG